MGEPYLEAEKRKNKKGKIRTYYYIKQRMPDGKRKKILYLGTVKTIMKRYNKLALLEGKKSLLETI